MRRYIPRFCLPVGSRVARLHAHAVGYGPCGMLCMTRDAGGTSKYAGRRRRRAPSSAYNWVLLAPCYLCLATRALFTCTLVAAPFVNRAQRLGPLAIIACLAAYISWPSAVLQRRTSQLLVAFVFWADAAARTRMRLPTPGRYPPLWYGALWCPPPWSSARSIGAGGRAIFFCFAC